MNTSTTTELYRTHDPKFTTYRGDGSGRDTYVIFEDGGLMPLYNAVGMKQRDTYN